VRDRMVYASSTAALKLGMGAPKFISPDFTLRDAKDCTWHGYEESRKKHAEEDVMTHDEKMATEAAKESIMSMGMGNTGTSKLSGMSDLPVKTAENAVSALQAVASGKSTTAVLFLDPGTEMLTQAAVGNFDIDGLVKHLPDKEPRFIVHVFKHEHPEEKESATATIFFYYCPNVAMPRLKMFYSSTKSNILKICEKFEIAITKNIELSEQKEMTKALVLDELYPKKVESKAFSKPSKPGKAKPRAPTAKFNAQGP